MHLRGWGGMGGGLDGYQPGEYVPLKALFQVFTCFSHDIDTAQIN